MSNKEVGIEHWTSCASGSWLTKHKLELFAMSQLKSAKQSNKGIDNHSKM